MLINKKEILAPHDAKFASFLIYLLQYYSVLLVFFLFSTSQLNATNTDSLNGTLSEASGIKRLETLMLITENLSEDEPSQALVYGKEALNLAKTLNHPDQEAKANRIMADATYYLQDYPTALNYYISSAYILEKKDEINSEYYISLLSDIGYCYLIMDQFPDALKYFNEALHLAIKANLPREISSNYNNLGAIYIQWGDYEKAAEYYQKSIQIDRDAGNTQYLSTGFNNLGKIYEHWGKYELAIQYYQEAYEIDSIANQKAKIAIRLNNLAIVYKSMEKYKLALSYFGQALEIERALGNNENVGRRLAYIGETWLDLKEYNIAHSYFQQSLPFLQAGNLSNDLARLYNSMAMYQLAIKNYPHALEMIEKSEIIAEKNNLKPLMISNYRVLSEIYEKSNQANLALENYKKYTSLKEEVFSKESDKKLAEYRALYENEKIHQENTSLRQDVEMKEQNQAILIFVLVLLLLIFLSTFFILRYRNVALKQQKIIAEKESQNLLKDLELKNNELTYNAMCIIKTNEVIARMSDTIKKNISNETSSDSLEDIFKELKSLTNEQAWDEFEVRFTQVHTDFYKRLNENFPDLSPNEKKLCAFLRLNMTTKDIATITHQTVHSINVARTRLRKKLNLANSDENLVNFLMNL